MLQGWQGWWTGGKYISGINKFSWTSRATVIEDSNPHWRFKKMPYEETCVWILQISVYNYTWGNYDCAEQTGYVCELSLADIK